MLTGKDKRTLKAMATHLPSVVQIGKEGLSDPVIDSTRAVLTARELIKIHVLNNADLDINEVMFKKKIEKSKFDFIKA